jgi:hypothetical protein
VNDHPTTSSRAPHPRAELLAEHAEGLLAEAEASRVTAHLEDCASCRATLAALGDVTGALRALVPAPMPGDVVARVDAALAAAAQEVGAGSAATVTPFVAPPRRRLARVLQIAAAIVLVGGAGALGVRVFGAGPDDIPTVAGRAETATAPFAGNVRITHSGRDYTADEVPDAARALVAGSPPDATTGRNEADTGGTVGADPAAAAACGRSLGGETVAIDEGRYAGEPAWLVVVPGDAGPGSLWAYVVPAGCPAGETLHFANVPAG